MLTRRFVLGGLIAAPAVIAADKLMPVRSIVKPYATVWGVGWDLEVVEHSVWTAQDALEFAKTNGGIEKFREVTEVVYAKQLPPLVTWSNHWTERKPVTDPLARFDYMLTPDNSRPEERMVAKFDPPDRCPSFIRRWSGNV